MKPQIKNIELRVKSFLPGLVRGKQTLATLLAPLGPKIRSISFPFANHLAKQQVLPYLFVEDLEDGDVVVVEEAPLGRCTFTEEAAFGRYHNEATWALRWTLKHQQERTLLSEGGPSLD